MTNAKRPSEKAERDTLRANMIKFGCSYEQIAAELSRRYGARPRLAWRHAIGWQQWKLAMRYNKINNTTGMTDARISEYETWPYGGSRPTIQVLVKLARTFGHGCTPAQLVDADDLAHMTPADRTLLLGSDSRHPAPVDSHTEFAPARHTETLRPPATEQPTGPAPTTDQPWATGTEHLSGPDSVERLIVMTAHESAHLGDHPSNVGPLTFDQLRADAVQLAKVFGNQPCMQVFLAAKRLRDQVFHLLDGRQRVSETRDLYFLAGVSLGMLASISMDLGRNDAAMTHARTGWICATESGHSGLMAWILGEQSQLAYYGGRPSQAVDYARLGQEHATTGTLAVRLAALEARAAGQLRDAAGTTAALDRVTHARDQVVPDDLDEIGGYCTFTEPKQHFYAAQAHLGLRDGAATIAEAQASLDGYRNGPAEERNYCNELLVQTDRANAHVLTGDLDGAQAAAQPVLQAGPGARFTNLDQALMSLHGALTHGPHREANVARQLRDQVEDFLGQTKDSLAVPPPTLPD